ncbi:hypothetical protein C0583_03815 [Candidatus Parcubacteria bacterium]|nr:MAG: hypothetical protein C0583_03815 [Candidatus Parcubacteria bacterium]
MKKYFVYFIKLLISLLLIFVIFSKIDFSEVSELLKKTNLLVLLIALFIFVLSWIVNSKKWQLLLRFLGFSESLWSLLKLNFISLFYASVLPGGQVTGETIKCYKISRQEENKGRLIISVIMDKIIGLIAFVWLGFICLIISRPDVGSFQEIFYVYLVFIIGSVVVLALFNIDFENILKTNKENSSKEKKGRIVEVFLKVLPVFSSFRGAHKTVITVIFVGMVFQFLNSFSVFLLAKSIGIQISFFDITWIYALVSIILVIPITILGLGLREGSFVYFLSLLGVANASALGLSLLNSLIYLSTGILGGILDINNKK